MNMRRDSTRTKVALIAGPTASGKSSLAMRIAERVSGTIINADSAQVYRDLQVLSARPSAKEESALPHLLFGYIDGAEACKVGEEQFVQMDDDLARHLRAYIRRLGDVDDTQPLFGFIKMVKKKGAKKAEPVWYSWVPGMPAFDKDLAHAGIEKKDETDRVVVFHSLRKSYITYLWMDDENRPQDVQRLARHSDLKLTQQVYTDWEMLAGREWRAAERLAGWMRG